MRRLIQVSLYDTFSQSSCHEMGATTAPHWHRQCARPTDLGYECTHSLPFRTPASPSISKCFSCPLVPGSSRKAQRPVTSPMITRHVSIFFFRFCRVDLQRPDMHIRRRRRLSFTTRNFLPRLSLTASYATSFVRTALGYAQRTANIPSTTCCPC